MTEEEKKAQESAAAKAAEAEASNVQGEGESNGAGDGANTPDDGHQADGGEDAGGAQGQGEGEEANESSPRDVVFERVRAALPDGKYDEDEQEYFRGLTSMLDRAELGEKKYNDLTDKLMRRYQEDPEEVAILMDYIEGTPLIDAIVKHKGEEALTMKEGMEGWDSYQEAVNNRKADRERYISLMDEVRGNLQSTVDEFTSWADELKLNDEQRAGVWEMIQGDMDSISRGKFTKEILNRYRDAMNHDNDVNGAYEQGKADGKNETIEATQARMKGSGLPGLNAGNAPKEKELNPREQLARKIAGWH